MYLTAMLVYHTSIYLSRDFLRFCELHNTSRLDISRFDHSAQKENQPPEATGFSLQILLAVETLVEALDTSAGINQLLLAREERVALGADFNLDVLLRRKNLDDIAAVAGDRGLLAYRMDAFLCH